MVPTVLVAVLCACAWPATALRAGVAKVDSSPPVGVPLAGYNHGARRVPNWPVPELTKYTTFMTPSNGTLEGHPLFAKALVLEDDSGELTAFVSIDAIGADGTLRDMALAKIQARGVNISEANFGIHGSHSHSGQGGVTPNFLWAMAPATDLLVPELQQMLCDHVVNAVVNAHAALQPAVLGTTVAQLHNVTVNRRAKISPFLKPDSIDPNLGIIRVDTPSGTPLATVWNFAIHGVCWGPDQMLANPDIMGGASAEIEKLVGGVAMFINADAGDIDPAPEMCDNKPAYAGAPIIANAVQAARQTAKTSAQVTIKTHSEIVPFGRTQLNITLSRWSNCTQGGFLDICSICRILKCDANLQLGSAWVDENPRFSAVRFDIGNETTIMVTMPGEPLSDLGFQVRGDLKAMGFDRILLAGYSQNHLGYFATAEEYDIGGYESELTFWGIDTADMVRKAAGRMASAVKPSM